MTWTLVTGGAKRLGREICLALGKKGHSIALHYQTSEAEAKEVITELRKLGARAEMIQGEFSSIETTRAFLDEYLKRFKETRGLINNVGGYFLGSPSKTPPEVALELFQTNVNAPHLLMQAIAPSLKKTKGKIVNIGMVGCSHVRANTHATLYNLTKIDLWMLTLSYAKELLPFGVTVNMVSPGYLEESIDLPPSAETVSYADVARAVYFFMDPENSSITGQNLEVAKGTRL